MKLGSLFIHRLLPLLIFCMILPACKNHHNRQHFKIDSSASAMEWKGYLKDGSSNNGTIQVKGDLFTNETGEITGGKLKLPLSSLININLPTDELKNQLVHHLQSPDFFNMVVYPEIGFQIISLTPILSGTYQAEGELAMLGKTNPVSFPVKIDLQGNRLEVTGETTIDRILWGMNYANDENAPNGMYIKPEIDVQFKLVALKDH